MTALLTAEDVSAGYGSLSVIRDVNLTVNEGEVVALLGPNGAGKTTTMMTLCGEITPTAGRVLWKGTATREPLHRRARDGLALITEERSVFMALTVAENLRIGGSDESALETFPELIPLLNRKVGRLSGGEQQILTVARALARHPQVVLADELSLGLAPLIARRLLVALRRAADKGVGVLLVEQHIRQAFAVADRVYILQHGQIQFAGTAADARQNQVAIEESYFRHTESAARGLVE